MGGGVLTQRPGAQKPEDPRQEGWAPPQVSRTQGLSRPTRSRWATLMVNPPCKGCRVPASHGKWCVASGVNADSQV